MALDPRFKQDLQQLLNRYALEKGSDTPDFLLAEYLVHCLMLFDTTVAAREQWYGRTTSGMEPVPQQGE